MRLFQAALDTCLDSPFLNFCQPLSSRFALHGLRALEKWRPEKGNHQKSLAFLSAKFPGKFEENPQQFSGEQAK